MKKTFATEAQAALNPAYQFISAADAETEATQSAAAPVEESKPERQPKPKRESKSRRLQLLLKPSTHDAIKEAAEFDGISVNEWINNALEEALKH